MSFIITAGLSLMPFKRTVWLPSGIPASESIAQAFVEAALDKAEAALGKSDVKTAKEQTKQAEGMLDKFARILGGD